MTTIQSKIIAFTILLFCATLSITAQNNNVVKADTTLIDSVQILSKKETPLRLINKEKKYNSLDTLKNLLNDSTLLNDSSSTSNIQFILNSKKIRSAVKKNIENRNTLGSDTISIDTIAYTDHKLSTSIPPLSVFLAAAEKHSTVRIFDAKKREAEYKLKLMKRNWLNYFSLGANYGYGKYISNSEQTDQYNPAYVYSSGVESSNYGIRANVTIPLGDLLGDRKLKTQSYQAQLDQMNYEYITTLEERKLIIVKAYNDVMKGLATIKVKAQAAAMYKAQIKLTEEDFKNGRITIIALSMERARLSGATEAYETARIDLKNSIMILEILSGVKIIN